MLIFTVSPLSQQSLLRSNLLKAVEATLRADERSCLEVIHLVELLLVLVTEGREGLPKAPHVMGMKRTGEGPGGGAGGGGSLGGDRSHRQVIEAIRSGNNEEFYEIMEAGMAGEEAGFV